MTGCCTSCAVRIKSGEIRQPEALGISAELKSKVLYIPIPLGTMAGFRQSSIYVILSFSKIFETTYHGTSILVLGRDTSSLIYIFHLLLPLLVHSKENNNRIF